MFTTCCIRVSSSLGGSTSKRAAVALRRQRTFSTGVKRNYMSTQPLASPEEEPRMMLILGKPGGGKGTISNKILKVRGVGPGWLGWFHRVAVRRRSLLDSDRNAFPRQHSRHRNGTFPLLNSPLMDLSYNQYIQSSHYRTFLRFTIFQRAMCYASNVANKRTWVKKPRSTWTRESWFPMN